MARDQTRDSSCVQKVGAKSENIKQGVEVAKRYPRATPERKPKEKGSLQDGKVGVGEAQKVGAYQQKVSKVTLQLTILFWVLLESGEHVVGQWCNWIIMKNWDLLHGMYGSMEAELEVQRTIKRAELTAFPCLLKKVIGPTKVYVDNKGIIDGLWRGERKCTSPKAGDADLWIKIWEELHILVEVEHV